MSPPVSFAKKDLGYPIFDAEFDPYNRGYLVVGGGGGEGRSGVKNKLTVLDVSSRAEVSISAELDLGQDEDSIQSLASLATPDGLITLTGINSAVADREAGKNEHLRLFKVDYPSKKRRAKKNAAQGESTEEPGKISLLSKSSLFEAASAQTRHITQKFVRLSPARLKESGSNKRLGAIATGLDKGSTPEGEVILFDGTIPAPDKKAICCSIKPEAGAHVQDLDLDEISEGSFALAFITGKDVFLYKTKYDFTSRKATPSTTQPINVYATSDQTSKRRLRSIRWLSPNHLLLLQNIPPRDGAELVILEISRQDEDASIVLVKRLPKSCKLAVGLDVCILDADPASGERQIIVAVSSQDYSIHTFTIDFRPKNDPRSQFAPFKAYNHFQDVHVYPITKIAFSKFQPPQQPKGSNMSVASSPQYIRLASVSLANTIVIDTFTLTSTPTSPSLTSEVVGKKKSPSVRWVLSSGGIESLRSWSGLMVLALIVLITAILAQSYFELSPTASDNSLISKFRGFLPPGAAPAPPAARSVVPPASESERILSDSAEASPETAAHVPQHHRLRDLLALRRIARAANKDTARHAIVVYTHPDTKELTASRHEDAEELKARGAVPFEDLSREDKEVWKQKLNDAGHWSVDEGETVLKGVLISQWAEIVGGAIRDAILH